MLGHSHAATGLLVGAVTAPFAPITGPVEAAVWVAGWAGFALLPDLDTNQSTAARMWGWSTERLAGTVGRLAGGHRAGTHDIVVAPIIVGLVVALMAAHPLSLTILLAVSIGLALLALDPILPGDQGHPAANAVVSWAAAIGLVWFGVQAFWWLPLVAAGGVIVHIFGDCVTKAGVPVPLTTWTSGGRKSWGPRLFTTGSGTEKVVGFVVWAGISFSVIALWRDAPFAQVDGDAARVVVSQGWEYVREVPYLIRDHVYGMFRQG